MRSLAAVSGLLLSFFAVAAGCGPSAPEPITPGPAPTASAAAAPTSNAKVVDVTLETVGLDPLAMDKSVQPCNDFYQFACGSWLKSTEIPSDEAAWTRSFHEIQKRNEAELKRILEEAAKNDKATDDVTKKIGAYYGACMDEAAVEAADAKPIQPLLAKAATVRDPKSLTAVIADLHNSGIWPLFVVSPWQDPKDATKWVANIDQGGIGLPDRDYYLRDDDASKKTRETYLAHVERMLVLAGIPAAKAKAAAADVMSVETELAKVSKTKVERRNPQGMFNKSDPAALKKAAPSFDWDGYWKKVGVTETTQINVTHPKFIEGFGALMTTVKPAAWQSYLQWAVVRSTARLLSKKFVDESFKLEQSLTGQGEQQARWKRCVDYTDRALGDLLAQPYVASSFPGDSKKAAEEMVNAIGAAFRTEVDRLDWMDAKTKEKSKAKLAGMAWLIGYPNKYKAYDFPIDKKGFAKNALASRAYELKRELAKVGKVVDRDEWQMSAPTVNAYYDPQRNHMVFPAGILQPPFYSVKQSAAVNLGAIGMVVGHELTHGFDDEGSQFDAKGNLANWWEPAVAERFKQKTTCVSQQYGAFDALPGLKLNGDLTLGENIADMGGVKLAFAAYRNMRKDAPEVTRAGGFNEDQQFFIAVAQAWCGKYRPELERLVVQTDPHSPNRFRVRGPLMNLPEFAQAFSCQAGSPMRPAKTCSVW